ncbi:MAG: ATP-dependent 6-phosphofructokinase [Thermodesulfobacteriota bacterium]|nr:ATP-dependent 6-phosphofructokinase [Thermodesulfobacteriota bacterium]
MDIDSIDTTIESLGEPKILSPLQETGTRAMEWNFISDSERTLVDVTAESIRKCIEEKKKEPPTLELAGPRRKIFFDPSKVRCALVTCGGLCPGLNDVIRAIVLELYYRYGVNNIYGIRYGLEGFIPEYGHEVVDLTPDAVIDILDMGGSILSSARGPQDIYAIVDSLERMNIGILFMIGGDGTLQAAIKIRDVITERKLKISVVGIPKTIDNDIFLTSRTFGFETAVNVATVAIKSAHNEARGYWNGIGLVKLMGRHSGFVAASAALAEQNVNFVLIPEVDFDLEGERGLLRTLEQRLERSRHAVIVVAEGAGQKFFEDIDLGKDPSGNVKLKEIGLFLKEKITSYFAAKKIEISLKYIDPSYMIRSLPANPSDSLFCSFLGRDAVHAGMAGKTNLMVGWWNNSYVHIPMAASAGKRKHVDTRGRLWLSVLESTGQPSMKNE